MSVPEAIAFVEAEARCAERVVRGRKVSTARSRMLRGSVGVQAVILPSQRRFIGRFLDLAKRVVRRGLGWLLTPLLGQINEFERLPSTPSRPSCRSSVGPTLLGTTMFDYDEFERRFRGDTELLKEKQRVYVPEFARGPVLDVGCGRGEFLELLTEAGIEALGVDLSLDMVTAARSKGLKVDHGDGDRVPAETHSRAVSAGSWRRRSSSTCRRAH